MWTGLFRLLYYFYYILNTFCFLKIPDRIGGTISKKPLSRSLRSSDSNNTSIENSKANELIIENPEVEPPEMVQNNGATSITTKIRFADLFASTASVETLTYWAKSGLQLPYIAELKTFWLGATEKPFKLRLRAPDPFLNDMKFNSDPADPFLDIHP